MHFCVRCIAFWADGGIRYFGKTGCIFPNVTDDNEDLYKSWMIPGDDGEEHTYKRCLRCFNSNQPCFAVPEELRGDFGKMARILRDLSRNTRVERRQNPNYVPATENTPAVSDPTIRGQVPLTEVEAKVLKFELMEICRPLSKKLNRDYSPQADRLYLHSGALTSDEEPCSAIHPVGTSRAKDTINAKSEAKKRAFESSVAQEVNTPKKKMKGRVVQDSRAHHIRDKNRLEGEIAEQERLRGTVAAKSKSAYTKRIKALQSQLAQVESQIE